MRWFIVFQGVTVWLPCAAIVLACAEDAPAGGRDAGTDTDADTDADGDTDADSDADTDADTDADADTNIDTESALEPDSDSGTGTHAGTWAIMPLGDSTTAQGVCWRARLWEKLDQVGYDFDFVGGATSSSGDCGSPDYDGDNEGHGGMDIALSSGEVTDSQIRGWFTANPADIVLMHFGTNDCWDGVPIDNIFEGYESVVANARSVRPNVIVLVAQIIPLNPKEFSCGACPERVMDLNAAIPGWAESVPTAASPVMVVDQWTGFDVNTDTTDGVHPYTDSGSEKIAANWFEALSAILREHLPSRTQS
jgi:hypothetical protein